MITNIFILMTYIAIKGVNKQVCCTQDVYVYCEIKDYPLDWR